MTLLFSKAFKGYPGKGDGAQCDTLVDSYSVSDPGGLAYYDTSTVINEETLTDVGPGVNVDARLAMGIFSHYAREQGNVLFIELMSHSVDCNSKEPRIAEDDFVIALCGRISLSGSYDILGKSPSQPGHFFKEVYGCFMAPAKALGAGEIVAEAFVANGKGNLLGQGLKESGDLLSEVITEVDPVHGRAYKIAGKEYVSNLFNQGNDRLA